VRPKALSFLSLGGNIRGGVCFPIYGLAASTTVSAPEKKQRQRAVIEGTSNTAGCRPEATRPGPTVKRSMPFCRRKISCFCDLLSALPTSTRFPLATRRSVSFAELRATTAMLISPVSSFGRFLVVAFVFFAAISNQAAMESDDILAKLSPAEIEARLPNEHPSAYYLYAGRLMKAGILQAPCVGSTSVSCGIGFTSRLIPTKTPASLGR
jgi:hypothetical protein